MSVNCSTGGGEFTKKGSGDDDLSCLCAEGPMSSVCLLSIL